MIAIIDYERGNLRSISNGLQKVGATVEIGHRTELLEAADGIVLPGVGAFGEGIHFIKSTSLHDELHRQIIQQNKPFLGICLGLQILADYSMEFGRNDGFGWVAGGVVRIEPDSTEHKIPHMGWNTVDVRKRDPLYRNLGEDPTFYFVHSFHFVPDDEDVVTSTTNHGIKLAASIQKGNIFGVQFHPEKSQKDGLQVLENFVDVVNEW